jgi:hypothetical protein
MSAARLRWQVGVLEIYAAKVGGDRGRDKGLEPPPEHCAVAKRTLHRWPGVPRACFMGDKAESLYCQVRRDMTASTTEAIFNLLLSGNYSPVSREPEQAPREPKRDSQGAGTSPSMRAQAYSGCSGLLRESQARSPSAQVKAAADQVQRLKRN